jgi:hypothetical protein
VGLPGGVAPDLGDVVELPRKSLMNVPERACVTAKRFRGRIAARRVSSGRGMAPISPGLAVCRQGPHWSAPATISSRPCVTTARARRYGLCRRPLLTRSASRRAKRAGALRDQAGRERYASHPGPRTCCRRSRSAARSTRGSRGRCCWLTCRACEACRQWWPMPSQEPRSSGEVASRKSANLTQAVSAPSDCWSAQVGAQPGAQRKGATSDA